MSITSIHITRALLSQLFSNPGWHRILSHLTLADLESVSKSHPKLRKLVISHLTSGHPLTIDEETVWKYPIEGNHSLYNRYGSQATNIVIDGIFEYDIYRLFALFPNIHQLTMRNVQINDCNNLQLYPFSVRKLCLVNSQIKRNDQWMNRMSSLESLFLQGNNTMPINTMHLKSLTLINQSYYWGDPCNLKGILNLKELTINSWDTMPGLVKLIHL